MVLQQFKHRSIVCHFVVFKHFHTEEGTGPEIEEVPCVKNFRVSRGFGREQAQHCKCSEVSKTEDPPLPPQGKKKP